MTATLQATGTDGPRRIRTSRAPATRPAPMPQRRWNAHRPHRPYEQGVLAVDFRTTSDRHFGPQATSRPELPDPEAWARRMVQAIMESLQGVRQPSQLVRWVTPEIQASITRRCAAVRRHGTPPRRPTFIRYVDVCEPADGVAEISAVVQTESRVRALALRMNGVDGRWLITELMVG